MIGCNSNINFGMPTLLGTRLTVLNIVSRLYFEKNTKRVLEDLGITKEDLKDALTYCSKLVCREDSGLVHYCDGCVLRTFSEGWKFDKNAFVELEIDGKIFTFSKDELIIYSGTIEEFENSEFGVIAWVYAKNLLISYL